MEKVTIIQTKKYFMNLLEQLRKWTTIVADTSDFASIAKYSPQDATTNPSLILSASKQEQYQELIEKALFNGKKSSFPVQTSLDQIFINFGKAILDIIPGRVSIEVDARDSFNTQKSIAKARHLISLFEKEKIDRSRILIKLASTWEGILAAKELQKENINCNMTLLFSLEQAALCAEAKATLISPFVGRILDWYKKNQNIENYLPHEDPGILSVSKIFHYFKKHNYNTQIMGASFRNIDEIIELAGCDLLTISPSLLTELQEKSHMIKRKLNPQDSKSLSIEKIYLNKTIFQQKLSQNKMASEKLSEGIEKFSRDIIHLENILQSSLEK